LLHTGGHGGGPGTTNGGSAALCFAPQLWQSLLEWDGSKPLPLFTCFVVHHP
jgi:hypothetical protein